MPIGNYTLDEIHIGDEVTFLCASVNTDHAWIVHGKDEELNKIYIRTHPESIKQDYWTLDVKEVKYVIPTSPLRSSTVQ